MQDADDNLSNKFTYDYTDEIFNPRKKRKLARKGFSYIEPLEEPGSIYQAEVHGSAQRLLNVHRITKYVKFCRCCCLPQQTTSVVVPFNCIDNKLDYGLGIYLYFYYIKFCIIMSIIIICLSSIPSMLFSLGYTNEIKKYCNKLTEKYNNTETEIPIDLVTNCSIFTDIGTIYSISSFIKMSFFSQMSASNIRYYRRIFSYNITGDDKYKTIDNVIIYFPFMYLLTGITVIIANILLNLHVNLLVGYENYKRTTPSDYTILIHGVPPPKEGENLQDKLKKIVEEVSIITGVHLEIYQIIPCLKFGEIYEKAKIKYEEETKLYHVYNLEKQKQLNRSKNYLESSDNLHYFHTLGCINTKTSIIDIKEKIDKIKKEVNEKYNDLKANPIKYNGGTFFLVFSKISMQEAFYDFYPHSYASKLILIIRYFLECVLFSYFVSDAEKKIIRMKLRIDVIHAAEAYEVQWENMGYSRIKRNLYAILSGLATTSLIAIVFLVIYGLNYLSYAVTMKKWAVSSYLVTLISLIISIFISISSQIGYYLLEKLTYLEKIEYRTDYIVSYSLKITLFDFIITGLLPVISHYLKGGLGNNDLLYNNVLMIFICNVFLPPVIFYYSPTLAFKTVARAKARLDLFKKKLENSTYTQRELNELFENPSINIYYKYSYVTNIIFNSVFYLPIFPLGMVIGCLALIFTYLSEFCYLGSYKRPEVLNSSLNKFYIGNFKWSMFIFVVGDYIFIGTISKSLAIGMPMIILIIFFLICVIPLQSMNFNFMGISEGDSKKVSYEQNSIFFSNDYEKLNPSTRIEGFIKYFNNLVTKKIISESDCGKILKKIKSVDNIDAYLKLVRNIDNYSSSQEQNNILMKNKIALKTDNLFEKLNESRSLPLLHNILTNREDYNVLQSNQFNRGKRLRFTSEELWKLKDCLTEYSMISAGISGALIFLGLKEEDIHDFIPFERNYNPWKVDWLFTPWFLEQRKKWIKNVRKYMDYLGEISDEEDTFIKFDQQESFIVDEVKKINEKEYEKERKYRVRNSILFDSTDFKFNIEEIQKDISKTESNEEKSCSQQTESKENIMEGIKLNDIQLDRKSTNPTHRKVNEFKKIFAEDNPTLKDKLSNSNDVLQKST